METEMFVFIQSLYISNTEYQWINSFRNVYYIFISRQTVK